MGRAKLRLSRGPGAIRGSDGASPYLSLALLGASYPAADLRPGVKSRFVRLMTSLTTSLRDRQRQMREEAILETAHQLLAEKGIQGNGQRCVVWQELSSPTVP